MMDYERSLIKTTWERNGTRYRRVITTDGETVVEKAEDGRYVVDYPSDYGGDSDR